MAQAPHEPLAAARRSRVASYQAVHIVLGGGSQVAVWVHFPDYAAQAIVDIPPALADLPVLAVQLSRGVVAAVLRPTRTDQVGGAVEEGPGADVLLQLAHHHGAVIDVVGRDVIDGAASAQAIGSVGERRSHAAFGAAREAVLAVPGVCPAARVRERVAVSITGDGAGSGACHAGEAVGGIVGVALFLCMLWLMLVLPEGTANKKWGEHEQ